MLRPRTHIWILVALFFLISLAGFQFMRIVDPFAASRLEFAIFYGLVIVSTFSLTAIVGYYLRIIFWQTGVRYEFLKSSRRQGMWFGLMVFSFLALKALGIFSVWTGLLLASAFILIEVYALVR